MNINKNKLEKFINGTVGDKHNSEYYSYEWIPEKNKSYRIVKALPSIDFLDALNVDVHKFVSKTITDSEVQEEFSGISQLEEKIREIAVYRSDLVQHGGYGYEKFFSDDIINIHNKIHRHVSEICWWLNNEMNKSLNNGKYLIIDEIEVIIYWINGPIWFNKRNILNDFKIVKNVFEERDVFLNLTDSERNKIFSQPSFLKDKFISSDFIERIYNFDKPDNDPSVNLKNCSR